MQVIVDGDIDAARMLFTQSPTRQQSQAKPGSQSNCSISMDVDEVKDPFIL